MARGHTMVVKKIASIFILCGFIGCQRETTKSMSVVSAASMPSGDLSLPCRWVTKSVETEGECVITEHVIVHGLLRLPNDLDGKSPNYIEIRDEFGQEIDFSNFTYDAKSQSLLFRATEMTPQLLKMGKKLSIRYSRKPKLNSLIESEQCSHLTGILEETIREITAFGATCSLDTDCEAISLDHTSVCNISYFVNKSILTERRREIIDHQIASAREACRIINTNSCGVDYPKTAVCNLETQECAGRY